MKGQVQSEQRQVRGVSYHVLHEGDGPGVLLLHGFTGSSKTFAPFLNHWAKTFHVVAVDLLGHGETEVPKDPLRCSLQETSRDLIELMARLGHEQFGCVGYSMGARHALGLAVESLKLGRHVVQSLILESGSPGLKDDRERVQRQNRDNNMADRIERIGVNAFVNEWERLPLFATQSQLPEAVKLLQRQTRRAHTALGLANSLRGAGTGAQPSLWNSLPHLTHTPTLLITGEFDEKFCNIAANMQRVIPHCRHVVVERAGHAVHLEQSDVYQALVARELEKRLKKSTTSMG